MNKKVWYALGAFALLVTGYLLPAAIDLSKNTFIETSFLAGLQEMVMFLLPSLLLLKAASISREETKALVKLPDPYPAGLTMVAAVSYVLSAVLITTITYSVLTAIGIDAPLPQPFSPETPLELVVAILTAAIIPAVLEESFFRLALPGFLQRKLKKRTAIILSSAAFAAMHLSLIAFPMLFLLGLLMHRLVDRHKSLLLPILFHGMYNFSVLIFNYTKAEPGFSAALLSSFFFILSVRFLLKEET